jgi:hypothetical protein
MSRRILTATPVASADHTPDTPVGDVSGNTPGMHADPTPAVAGLRTRSLLWRMLAAVAVTRVVLAITAWLVSYVLPVQTNSWALRYPKYAEAFHGFLGHLLNPWARWDGVWFIKIAHSGYSSADGSTAFFPLYPSILRYAGYLFDGNLVATGIIVSLLCYFAACVFLYKLVLIDLSPRVAYWSVILLSVFPTTFFFGAVYSESLFLLTSVACLYWARGGRWRRAGIAGLLATLTRNTGVLLVVPMAMFYYEQRGWNIRRTDAKLANLLMVPEGLLVWMTYLSVTFHSPLLFVEAQNQWNRYLALPTTTIWRGFEAAVQGTRQLVSRQLVTLYWPVPRPGDAFQVALANIDNLLAVIIAVVCIAYGWRRLPPAYTVYAALAIGFPLFFPAPSFPFYSLPRLMLSAFPVFIAMAIWAETHPRARLGALVLMAITALVLVAKFSVFSWVA